MRLLTKSWRDDWLEPGISVGRFGPFGPLGPSLLADCGLFGQVRNRPSARAIT